MKADRVQLLAGAAGADHDLETCHVLARRADRGAGVLEHGDGNGKELGRIRQPSDAGIRSGQPSHIGPYDDGAATAQRGHIGLRCGVQPHLGVHGGRKDNRAVRGQ